MRKSKLYKYYLLLALITISCGNEDDSEARQGDFAVNPAVANSGDTTDSYTYGVFEIGPSLNTEQVIASEGVAFLVSGEVLLTSQDYCEVRAKVAVQQPGSSTWKIIRSFALRGVEGSNSKVSSSVSFVLPRYGKFKVYDLELIKAEGYPDAPCTTENFSIGAFTSYRIR